MMEFWKDRKWKLQSLTMFLGVVPNRGGSEVFAGEGNEGQGHHFWGDGRNDHRSMC